MIFSEPTKLKDTVQIVPLKSSFASHCDTVFNIVASCFRYRVWICAGNCFCLYRRSLLFSSVRF